MSETKQAPVDVSAQVSALRQVLAEEHARYEALLEQAREQGRLMTGHDLDAIERSAQAMAQGLAEAAGIRQRREELTAELMRSTGHRDLRLSAWLATQPDIVRTQLQDVIARVREAGARLMEVNEKNRRLASFCLDLVEEEAGVLRQSLLEDPAGRYDRGARPASADGGRMVQRQA
ncbi:hypothetical protein GF314_10795 [bacterium]|nr:hypothetical protein [bacterium]